MRTFSSFPKQSICPICGNNEDKECILMPIAEEKHDGENCVKAQPVHTECLQKQLWFYRNDKLIICKADKL